MAVPHLETRLFGIDLQPLELHLKVFHGIGEHIPLHRNLFTPSRPLCLHVVTVAVLHSRPEILKSGVQLKLYVEKFSKAP